MDRDERDVIIRKIIYRNTCKSDTLVNFANFSQRARGERCLELRDLPYRSRYEDVNLEVIPLIKETEEQLVRSTGSSAGLARVIHTILVLNGKFPSYRTIYRVVSRLRASEANKSIRRSCKA